MHFDLARTRQRGECERVVVTTGDGRTFDLGSPNSRLFKARVTIYKLRRKIHG